MKLSEVPYAPAYFVCHDLYDNGSMDVTPCASLEVAQLRAKQANDYQNSMGEDGCRYEAYTKLPRRRIWRFAKVGFIG